MSLVDKKGPTTCWTCLKWFARTSSISFSCSMWAFTALIDCFGGLPTSPGTRIEFCRSFSEYMIEFSILSGFGVPIRLSLCGIVAKLAGLFLV